MMPLGLFLNKPVAHLQHLIFWIGYIGCLSKCELNIKYAVLFIIFCTISHPAIYQTWLKYMLQIAPSDLRGIIYSQNPKLREKLESKPFLFRPPSFGIYFLNISDMPPHWTFSKVILRHFYLIKNAGNNLLFVA